MCVGVSVWLGWSGVRVAGYRFDDTRGCVMQFWPPDDEHMCSKHVEAWNKFIVKRNFCASSWLITKIDVGIVFNKYNKICNFLYLSAYIKCSIFPRNFLLFLNFFVFVCLCLFVWICPSLPVFHFLFFDVSSIPALLHNSRRYSLACYISQTLKWLLYA